jgi:hypothetical protein
MHRCAKDPRCLVGLKEGRTNDCFEFGRKQDEDLSLEPCALRLQVVLRLHKVTGVDPSCLSLVTGYPEEAKNVHASRRLQGTLKLLLHLDCDMRR